MDEMCRISGAPPLGLQHMHENCLNVAENIKVKHRSLPATVGFTIPWKDETTEAYERDAPVAMIKDYVKQAGQEKNNL